jgi:hypothetical protein
MDRSKKSDISQRGNVFFIILIGIVLFAALMFTFSRGVRQGTESMSGREAELIASDVVSYGQKVQRGIERMIGRGVSESDISFANPVDTNYVNLNCTNDKCLVFSPEGGAVGWKDAPSGTNAGDLYFFGPNRVGTVDGVTKNIGTTARDLVMILPVEPLICDSINGITSKLATWKTAGPINITNRFTGDYLVSAGTTISYDNDPIQPTTGCFCTGAGATCTGTDPHYYFTVLLAR